MRYWEYRILQLEDKLHLSAKEKEKVIQKAYVLASLGMTDEINALLENLEEGASLSDLNKFLSIQATRDFQLSNEEYVRTYKKDLSTSTVKDIEKVNNAKRMQIRTALGIVIGKYVERAVRTEERVLNDHLKNVYDSVYETVADDMNLLLGRPKKKPKKNRVAAIINARWADDNRNITERIGLRRRKLENELLKEVERSITLSRNAPEVKAVLNKRMMASKSVSDTLLETEATRVFSEAQADSSIDHGVEEYINIATLDSKTTEICRNMDKQVYKLKDRVVGVNAPPYHYRCRTVTAIYFNDTMQDRIMERLNDQRMSRPPTTGKSEYTDDLQYFEWARKYGYNTVKIDLQLFAAKDIKKQSVRQLRKGIRSYNKRIAEHQFKIKNPELSYKDWDTYDERKQKGAIEHWKKEIRNFENSILENKKELEKRGEDYD